MTKTLSATPPPSPAEPERAPVVVASSENIVQRILRALLTQRVVLLAVLIGVVLVTFVLMGENGYLTASFDGDSMAAALINAVPLAILGFAQLVVIMSGRGGIDLSVGAIVSLAGMIFGIAYAQWGLPLWLSIAVTLLAGGVLGAINGFLVAYVGFPALIVTLATLYAYKSIAVVINDKKPINSPEIAALYGSTAKSVELPVIGQYLPDFPRGLFLFLIPTMVIVWVVLAKTTLGRRLYAIGTNDVAAKFAAIDVRATRFKAYIISGLLSGLVAVVTVGQFASSRPDSGTSGSGMALPAITIAVLGGVAITGGIGRVAGVVLATLLVVWLNDGILKAFVGNAGSQYQLLALGVVLVFAALLNGLANRKYGGAR